MIKAIVFDMDGVLIDAKEWHYEALNKALTLFGYEINRYEHLVTYDGLSTTQKLEMLSMEKNMPRKLHSFINELKQQYTVDKILTECRPIFTHEYALSKLKNDGYKIAVASNSIKNTIELMMQKSNLMKYLDFYMSNQDVLHPKPDSEIYDKTILRLEISPDECVVVEDNHNGIQAARNAGAHVFEVSDVYDVNYERIKNYIMKVENGD